MSLCVAFITVALLFALSKSVLERAIYGYAAAYVGVLLWVTMARWRNWRTTYDIGMSIMKVVAIPAFIACWPLMAATQGWRAVLLAIAFVAGLILVNALFLYVLDPILIDPPPWLQQFIDADPQALREAPS